MRLAIVLTQPFWFDGKQYTTKYPFASFIVAISKHVDSLIVFVPLKRSTCTKAHHLVCLNDNVKIIPYPFYESLKEQYLGAYRILPDFIKIFNHNKNLFDVCGFVSTSIISLVAFSFSKLYKKKVFLYLRADVQKAYTIQIRSLIGRSIGLLLGYTEELFCRIMIKRNPTIVIGEGLYRKYNKKHNSVYLFYSNLISKKIIKNSNPPKKLIGEKGPILLSVGRLVPQKGMEFLVDAVDKLKNRKDYSPLCYIVGSGIEEKILKRIIKKKELEPYFIFLGNIPWGEKLFDIYRKSDLFILPSITEGFPKTIFEAMALGVPVIASDVGGISGIIKNEFNGILVQAKSSRKIVSAIIKIWTNEVMYNKIIGNGLRTVKNYTVEKQTKRLVSIIKTEFSIN